MEKENVLKIKIKKINDKWSVGYVKYQDEEVLKRNNFSEDELNVESMYHPEYKTDRDRLYIRGFCEEDDLKPFIIPNEKVELVKEKINTINEKYGKPKRWRAEYNERYYYFTLEFEVQNTIDYRDIFDDKKYELRNYFKTEEEAQKYANKLKKMLSERE